MGAREAAARRGVAMEQEVRIQREEEAHYATHVRGRGEMVREAIALGDINPD